MPVIQRHHIDYEDNWTVELPAYLHKSITIIQRSTPNTERYVLLTNFMHAVTNEWNRYRKALDLRDEMPE